MMTDEQKKQAAMELCRLRGIDPNEKVPQDNPLGFALFFTTAFELALKEIIDQETLESAMQFGRSYKE